MTETRADDDLLVFRLLAIIAGGIYAGLPHPDDRRPPKSVVDEQLMEHLRGAFRRHRPDVDVSEDVDLGRAIEALAVSFRDRAQPEDWR